MGRSQPGDLRRTAVVLGEGLFWGLLCGAVAGAALGMVFGPFGTAVGAVVGAMVGLGLGGLCGVVLAAFVGIHACLGHDRAAVARDVPAVAVLVVAVTAAVVYLTRDPYRISTPLVVLPSLFALPSAWFAGRHVARRLGEPATAEPPAAEPPGPSRPS